MWTTFFLHRKSSTFPQNVVERCHGWSKDLFLKKSLAEFRRRCGERKLSLFFPATCAWEKTLLGPGVPAWQARVGPQTLTFGMG
jgi:hypothetical protein